MRLPIDLIEVPAPLPEATQAVNALLFDVGCKHQTEPSQQGPGRLVRSIDPAPKENLLHNPQVQWEQQMHHCHEPIGLEGCIESTEWAWRFSSGFAADSSPIAWRFREASLVKQIHLIDRQVTSHPRQDRKLSIENGSEFAANAISDQRFLTCPNSIICANASVTDCSIGR